MYSNGQGVPQDFVQTHMWFNLAAAQGNAEAKNFRNLIAKDMTSEQIAEAQRLAREWRPK
jgi:TPR repeat protein